MGLARPPVGSPLAARLAGRFHPRRLRRRLPLALVVGVAVALAPGWGLRPPGAAGPGRSLLVATTDLPAGHTIADGDLRPVIVPPALVPAGAVAEVPPGTVLRAAVGRGEIVVAARVGRGPGIGGRLDPGHRAVAVPWAAARLPLAVGDAVDLVATTADGPDGAVQARLLASGAVVLAVADDGVTVAVAHDVVPAVAEAIAAGVVDLAVSPLGP